MKSMVRERYSLEGALLPIGWLLVLLTMSMQFWAEEFTGDADWDDGWFEGMIMGGVLLGCALLSRAARSRNASDRRILSFEGPAAFSTSATSRSLPNLRSADLSYAGEERSEDVRRVAVSGKNVAVILPAFNAAQTLQRTFDEIPREMVDDLILTDDGSSDNTAELARSLGIHTVRHDRNRGYGGNQKTCYAAALERGADIVVMVHPDYQYSPRLVPAMAAMIASGHYDVVLASRILGNGALRGGMPLYKYAFNRMLTLAQNLLIGQKLSEYHTGYRAWSRTVLETLPLLNCSDNFVFDNQMLSQAHYSGFRIGEISCPTRYFPEASSINFRQSVVYGLGVLRTSLAYRLHCLGLIRSRLFTRAPDARLPNSRADQTGAAP